MHACKAFYNYLNNNNNNLILIYFFFFYFYKQNILILNVKCSLFSLERLLKVIFKIKYLRNNNHLFYKLFHESVSSNC